jgi:hypothetical protein
MTELSHPHPPAMGIGHLHAASLTDTVAVVVDRFLPSSELSAAETETPPLSLRSVVDRPRAA